MNPTTTNTTKTTDIAADLQTYMAKKLLAHANVQTVYEQFGKREDIPAGNSKTIQFVQYADLAIVTSPLTEGQAPAGKKLQNSPITATIDQLGDFTVITDLAGLTPKHPIFQEALKLLGDQAAKSLDFAVSSVLKAGTAVRYAGGASTRAGLVALADGAGKIKWQDVRREVTRLRKAGAHEFNSVDTRDSQGRISKKAADGNFVLIVSPSVEQDLMDDPSFEKAANAYAGKAKKNEFYKGTIVEFAGVTVVRTNHAAMAVEGGKDVHISILLGMNAYGNTDLQKLKTYKQGPGGVTDPLEQIMTLGWKAATKSVILNNNWMGRIESTSEY